MGARRGVDEPLPEEFGEYRVVRRLGGGAMGDVFLAEHRGEQVAIKVVHPSLLAQEDTFNRFLREVESGRRVDHPNVVRTTGSDLFVVDGSARCLLVMEFVEGRSLDAVIDDLGPLPEPLVREIARQALAGLGAIHAVHIIHRDVKPANLMLTDDHRLRIMDLGVAKLVDAATKLTATGMFTGTLTYAAPEQLRGEDVTPAADLYALGVVLRELALGENAFWRRDIERVVEAHLRWVPPQLCATPCGFTPFFSAIVATLLAKDRSKRFATAEDALAALRGGEEGPWWRKRRVAYETASAFRGKDPVEPPSTASRSVVEAGRRDTTLLQLSALQGPAVDVDLVARAGGFTRIEVLTRLTRLQRAGAAVTDSGERFEIDDGLLANLTGAISPEARDRLLADLDRARGA